jgi:hypothetical protein
MLKVKEAVNFLNELLELDKPTIEKLVAFRVRCNDELTDHKTVQVVCDGDSCRVGLIGIVNGLIKTGKVAAVYNDYTHELEKFVEVK